ncbi:hypothetical protein GCM10010174_64440 [Kutzneria viridogrisea]|uniref:Tryptophan synthase beta chain-like PALP domain-containing protein n=2 Tax=Kutzneria TaxID=43356 RepID=W5WHX4_9PSEU|nr:hypothetical protein KALB_7110 [Kutzneria albida DSM 43870]MBA8925647.1 threonine synthase [Kutzneria viridogrisea]
MPGNREATAAAAVEEVTRTGDFYATHVYNPLFHIGTATFAFEVWEQLGGRLPDTFVLPVGNGTLVLGRHKTVHCGRLSGAAPVRRRPENRLDPHRALTASPALGHANPALARASPA